MSLKVVAICSIVQVFVILFWQFQFNVFFHQDIRNQRRYRQRRKQELTKLKQNMERLDQKAKFFEEQSDYYNQYIKSCLQSLANKSNKK